MHIEKRRVGERTKYYLAHSFRKGKKVKKIRIYLGADLSEEKLALRKKEAGKKIKQRITAAERITDPYMAAISLSEIKELQTLEAHGRIRVFHLSELDWQKFTEAFTYDTNAIEGSSIKAREVKEILEKEEWPEERTKEELAEVYGVVEAVAHIRKIKEHLSLSLIKKLHAIVFKNSKAFAGRFRDRGVEVVIADASGNTVHRGAPSEEVPTLLKKLIGWYAKNKNKYTPLVLAAVVHNQFENIHPFRDGNGRVGRLLLNNILLKHNLPPLNIELRNRPEYYKALQEYEKSHNIRPMIILMLKEYRTLRRMLRR
ncbi:MAG: Fic family protein [Candidatus Micrarchaeota archaeon]